MNQAIQRAVQGTVWGIVAQLQGIQAEVWTQESGVDHRMIPTWGLCGLKRA